MAIRRVGTGESPSRKHEIGNRERIQNSEMAGLALLCWASAVSGHLSDENQTSVNVWIIPSTRTGRVMGAHTAWSQRARGRECCSRSTWDLTNFLTCCPAYGGLCWWWCPAVQICTSRSIWSAFSALTTSTSLTDRFVLALLVASLRSLCTRRPQVTGAQLSNCGNPSGRHRGVALAEARNGNRERIQNSRWLGSLCCAGVCSERPLV